LDLECDGAKLKLIVVDRRFLLPVGYFGKPYPLSKLKFVEYPNKVLKRYLLIWSGAVVNAKFNNFT